MNNVVPIKVRPILSQDDQTVLLEYYRDLQLLRGELSIDGDDSIRYDITVCKQSIAHMLDKFYSRREQPLVKAWLETHTRADLLDTVLLGDELLDLLEETSDAVNNLFARIFLVENNRQSLAPVAREFHRFYRREVELEAEELIAEN